jgi:LPXTG-site transpeptidase (sortase) family protein
MLNRSLLALAIALAILLAWSLSGPLRPVVPPSGAEDSLRAHETVALPPRLRTLAMLAPAHPATDARLQVDAQAAPPRRIDIPAIGVSAPVIALGLNPDGTLQTPSKWGDTGWYEPGPEPGEQGAAVIAGHVDSTTGPAVFYRLRALRIGDRIRVRRRDGSVVRFRVQRVESWPKSDFPTRRVYGPTHGSVLRLVTCAGNFNRSTGHYVDNTIVYATRI